ncbi:MAG: tetratricopeptide repeat protein [Gammaproteobacteria bacterium]
MHVKRRIRFALAVLLLLPFALAREAVASSATPLLDYAQDMPLPEQPNGDSLSKRLASVQAEMQRHPPPPESDCAHTLGASRFAESYGDLGEARSATGDYPGAIDAFENALSCSPRSAAIHSELAAELMHVNRLAEARTIAERGIALDGDERSLDTVLSQLDFIQERWANAVARLRTLAVTETDGERATYWQCFLWLAQRRAGTQRPELPKHEEYTLWPAFILDALQGHISEQELLGVLRKEDDEHRRRELLAEALYYVGQLRLANGDADTARRYFAATVNLKVLYFIEHHMALAELARMRADGAPAAAATTASTRRP